MYREKHYWLPKYFLPQYFIFSREIAFCSFRDIAYPGERQQVLLTYVYYAMGLAYHYISVLATLKKKKLATFNKLKWSVGNSLLHYLLYYLLVLYLVT